MQPGTPTLEGGGEGVTRPAVMHGPVTYQVWKGLVQLSVSKVPQAIRNQERGAEVAKPPLVIHCTPDPGWGSSVFEMIAVLHEMQ